MSWSSAITDVRTLISDGATDKLRYRKEIFGNIDGSNVTFKTFEMRRITNFTTAAGTTLGVFDVTTATKLTVTSDDVESGELVVSSAPPAGDSIRATYYVQWFNDAEIIQFLATASEWIQGTDDYTTIANNLQPAAKHFAAGSAYQKLSLRFAQNLAEQFQLYDAPDQKRFDPISVYDKLAKGMFKLAFELRDDTYKNRQGQALAPLFGTVKGRMKDVPPNS